MDPKNKRRVRTTDTNSGWLIIKGLRLTSWIRAPAQTTNRGAEDELGDLTRELRLLIQEYEDLLKKQKESQEELGT